MGCKLMAEGLRLKSVSETNQDRLPLVDIQEESDPLFGTKEEDLILDLPATHTGEGEKRNMGNMIVMNTGEGNIQDLGLRIDINLESVATLGIVLPAGTGNDTQIQHN